MLIKPRRVNSGYANSAAVDFDGIAAEDGCLSDLKMHSRRGAPRDFTGPLPNHG
jgi:hypothetical protein